jgi:hypothetical protein
MDAARSNTTGVNFAETTAEFTQYLRRLDHTRIDLAGMSDIEAKAGVG